MENKVKHLEFIQNIIQRMSYNSFLTKGWVILGIIGLTSFANKEYYEFYILFLMFIIFIFWILDSYFLTLERLFRDLYNEVRKKEEINIDFSMNIGEITFVKMLNTFCSITKLLFYGGLMSLILYFYFLIK